MNSVSYDNQDLILKVRGLKKHFPVLKGFIKKQVGSVKAVDGLDMDAVRG